MVKEGKWGAVCLCLVRKKPRGKGVDTEQNTQWDKEEIRGPDEEITFDKGTGLCFLRQILNNINSLP